MRSVTVLLLLLLSGSVLAQQPSSAADKLNTPVKIKHEALEFRSDMAYYKGKPFTGLSFTFWENKRINEQFSWVNGLKEGEYKDMTENGTVVTLLTYYQGKKHGPFIYRYFTGAIQSEGAFYYEELDGLVSGFYSTGIKKYEVRYVRGVRQGESKSWFKNGAPEQIAYYVNDYPHGEVIEYYQDSLVWSESEYNMGVRQGRYYQFHRKSGCPAIESYFKNGKLDSIRRIWNEVNCGLIEEEHYRNGKKHGQFVLYDFTGDTLTVKTYSSDVLDGEYREYYTKMKADKDGETVNRYHNNYGIEVLGQYVNGEKDGFWQYGLTSNYQHREGNYALGVQAGEWVYYDLKGRILMRQWFNGEGEIEKEKRYRRPRKKK